jgi:ABC-2 type transport system ATP-binding protein
MGSNSSNNSEVAISVDSVSKTFKLPHEKHSSVKSLFVNFYRRRKTYELQRALNDVSFQINKGEFFGIVGRNGSGKSTLLKLIAGIYSPSKGSIKINGSLTPFIELGVGFNKELTGRENVFLNGALLGFSRKQMKAMYKDIVEFAELEKFMDQKLKNYSSGMQVRLAFSIAIRAQSDILLLDEVLAVGDDAFKRKCLEYFEQIKRDGRTVIFVTHDMNSMKQYCDKAILVDSGKIVESGSPEYIAEKYIQINLETTAQELEKNNEKKKRDIKSFGDGRADIINIWTSDKSGKKKNHFRPNEAIVANVEIRANDNLEKNAFGIVFTAQNGNNVLATNTLIEKVDVPVLSKNQKIVISLEVTNIFNDGFYTISSAFTDFSRRQIHSRVLDMHKFEVAGWELQTAITHPKTNLIVKTRAD